MLTQKKEIKFKFYMMRILKADNSLKDTQNDNRLIYIKLETNQK